MTAIVRNDFRVFNVKTFKNIFSVVGNSLYMGIGRPEYWDLVQSQDTAPDAPQNNESGSARDWEDMMHLKLVNPANISHGIFREQWTANTKYDAYRHDWNANRASVYNGSNGFVPQPSDLSEAKYYVVTSNYNTYICLKHAILNGVVQPSTQNPETGTPVGTNTGIYKTSDGYYWKFVSVTSPTDVVNFTTDTFHPVKTLTVAPGNNDPYFVQWTQQNTNSAPYKRGVYVINVTSAGSGYNAGSSGTVAFPSANIVIGGDGAGIAGTVTFGTGGSVQSIEITNPGSGYTFLTMTLYGGNGFFAYDPIYTPAWGLGADPVRDLSAYYAIVNNSLNSTEGGVFTVTNAYRKICLIANPTEYNSTAVCTAQTRDATLTINMLSGTGFLVNDIVTDSATGAKGRVVDWDNTTKKLRVIRTSNENYGQSGASSGFSNGSTVTGAIAGSGVIQTLTNPTVKSGSGSIIYTEYRTPITRSLGQSENLTLVLEF